MKSNFDERMQARLEAFQRLSAKNATLSESSHLKAMEILRHIPAGQPVLIGHHSEKRHRRDLNKIDNAMSKSVEAQEKAAYYKERVESILNNKAISSDDPNAVEKLQEKLERLEAKQEIMKAANKIIKGKGEQVEKVKNLVDMGMNEIRALSLFTPDFAGRIGFTDYVLTNNNATIRATRKRIEQLNKIESMQSSEEEINGSWLVVSVEDNRVQLFFDSKPSEEIRKKLKSNGFHWAPSVGAWMRQLSQSAIYYGRQILKGQ